MKILFMCVANSARSQMAEGLAKAIFPEAEIMSAGSKPGKVNPLAIEALGEIGIDIRSHHSKGVDSLPSDFSNNLNYVITLCAEEVCPVIIAPNAKRIHLPLTDPVVPGESKEMGLQRFCKTRDELRKLLLDLAVSLRQ